MSELKHIHFGHFISSLRVARGWTIKNLAAKVGMSEPRIVAIEKMAEPKIYASSFGKLAGAFDMTPDGLSEKWQTTPVTEPRLSKAGVGVRPIPTQLTVPNADNPERGASSELASEKVALASDAVEMLTHLGEIEPRSEPHLKRAITECERIIDVYRRKIERATKPARSRA